MKLKLIFTMAIGALLIISCSPDNLDDPTIATYDFEMKRPQIDQAPSIMQPIHLEGYGKFYLGNRNECPNLRTIMMEGVTTDGMLGDFYTTATKCTDLIAHNFIKGELSSARGAGILYFYSEESGNDMNGNWYIYVFTGGSGEFTGVTGEVKVYIDEDNRHNYRLTGKGYLMMPLD